MINGLESQLIILHLQSRSAFVRSPAIILTPDDRWWSKLFLALNCLLSQNWSNWADSNLEVGIISFEAIKNYYYYIISKATFGKGAICPTRDDGGPAWGLFSKLLIASSTNFVLFSKFWFASLVVSICYQVTPVMISVHRFPVLPPWHKWLPWCCHWD